MSDELDTEAENPSVEESPPPVNSGFDLSVVIDQAKQVITDPGEFYRTMSKNGGYSEPLIFAVVMAVGTGAIFALLSIVGITGAGFAGLGAIVVLPIGLAIGSFIGAAIMFIIWKLMGSPEDFETAYRCIAYSSAVFPIVTVLSLVPYLGTLISIAWGTWLMITASTQVHGRAFKTSAIVFGILGLLNLMSSITAEKAQHNVQDAMDQHSAHIEERLKSLETLGLNEDGEIDPEKAGEALGQFLKGLQKSAEELEEAETD